MAYEHMPFEVLAKITHNTQKHYPERKGIFKVESTILKISSQTKAPKLCV